MTKSIKKETAIALGIDHSLIPERLRNRLNGYLDNGTIPRSMVNDVPHTSESHKYTPRPIVDGNQVFLRNLVFLDTLFDDTKAVKRFIHNSYTHTEREEFLNTFHRESIAKLELFKSLIPMLDSILDFLEQDNIDWNVDELPCPYTNTKLMVANLSLKHDLSIYDQTLKYLLNQDLRNAHQLLQDNPEQFANADAIHLKTLIEQRYAEYSEYAEYLKNF
ncbi:hypothetical protein A8139_14720 [Marinomonas primoryensis]|uniref:Uncharacterized protein n=1 Tax=Marinomonas primoryensis TaxID=178399 RepID=A0A2Z4PU13_9GAMM|nr:hypothetical protein [Marinomonas primoryensis]AWY01092.1 hypothetical protein A8139_14720 [Marinomonas primoryensis]